MATNDITGDALRSKLASDAYRENFDRVFGKNNEDDKNADSGNSRFNEGTQSQADQTIDQENGSAG